MSELARNDVSLAYIQMILVKKKNILKNQNGRRWPYWIMRNVTTSQKSVSTKVVPMDPRNLNPVSFALPLKIQTNT